MRVTAGIVYGVLAVLELFSLRFMLNNAAITSVPIAWLFEMAIMLGAGVLCVWLLGGRNAVPINVRRAVVAGTTLVVIFELVSYSTHTEAINYTLTDWFPSLAQSPNTIYLLVVMILRLLLMILAAFFVQSACAEMDAEQAEDEAEDALEQLDEVMANIEKARENGLSEEEAAEVVTAVSEAEEELAEAMEQLDEAVEEMGEENKK